MMVEPVLSMPRPVKRIVALGVDLTLCVVTVWLAFYLRLGEFISLTNNSEWAPGALRAGAVSIGIAIPLFIVSGLYRAIFRYSGWPALMAVARAVGLYGLVYASIFTVIGVTGVPRTVGIIQPMLLLLLVGSSRLLARVWLGDQYISRVKQAARPRVLIYGTGMAGRQLATALEHSREMQVVGFLEDDDRLHAQVLNGRPVYDPANLTQLAIALEIRDVFLALPGLSRSHRNQILTRIRGAHVAVRTLPSLSELAQGKVTISDLRELDIDDILGREPVAPDTGLLKRYITGKVVLVTRRSQRCFPPRRCRPASCTSCVTAWTMRAGKTARCWRRHSNRSIRRPVPRRLPQSLTPSRQAPGAEGSHGGCDLAKGLGPCRSVLRIQPTGAPYDLHHQRHREPSQSTAQDHQNAGALSQRRRRNQTAVAGTAQHHHRLQQGRQAMERRHESVRDCLWRSLHRPRRVIYQRGPSAQLGDAPSLENKNSDTPL